MSVNTSNEHVKHPGEEHTGQKSEHFDAYAKPGDVSRSRTVEVLTTLNSFVSSEQLMSSVHKHASGLVLSTSDAHRIISIKEKIGGFRDLRQLMYIRGIGVKKFDVIVRALSSQPLSRRECC